MQKKKLDSVCMVLLLIFSLFAAVPVYAEDGDGTLMDFTPKVISVDAMKDLVLTFENTGDECIEKIWVEAPDDLAWSGVAVLESATHTEVGTIQTTTANEDHDGTSDDQSLAIEPGLDICMGETVVFTIKGLETPAEADDAKFMIYTRDTDGINGNNPTVIDNHDSCVDEYGTPLLDSECSFLVKVTEATDVKVEYMHLTSVSQTGSYYTITGRAKGAWARLDELYLESGDGSDVDAVYMDKNGNGVLDMGIDYELTVVNTAATGLDVIELGYSGSEDIVNQVTDGFVKDWEQGGIDAKYFVETDSDPITVIGHADSPADSSIDPTRGGTGLTASVGTVISVEEAMKRSLKLQIVKDVDGYLVDVKESNIPISFATDLSTFSLPAERLTDVNGQVEQFLLAGTVAGYADVEYCFPDPVCHTEVVGINAGVADDFEITQGLDTQVVAGTVEYIEATIYDQFDNVITNSPARPRVNFNLLSKPDIDGSLDDDDNPGTPSDNEEELADMGIGDVNLQTSATIGVHTVEVCVEGLGCKETDVEGIIGAPYKVVIESDKDQMACSECVDFTVMVTDEHGNVIDTYLDPITGHAQEWSSMVRFEILNYQEMESDQWSNLPHIESTTFDEEDNNGYYADGKVVDGVATVTVCGAMGLGDLEVSAKTDTLVDGEYSVHVINGDAYCIAADVKGKECATDYYLNIGIKDVCGNYIVGRQCNGPATSCFDVASDRPDLVSLSTETICVDLYETGMAPEVTVTRLDMDACGLVTFDATDAQDCCDDQFPSDLPMCHEVTSAEPVAQINFIGAPATIESSFEPANPALVDAVAQGYTYASEETYDYFTVYDLCRNVVPTSGYLDVEIKGEDCTSFIEVESSTLVEEIELPNQEMDACLVDKIVIDNCNEPIEKRWTDLEEGDIMVDKLAFSYYDEFDRTDAYLYVYAETEVEPGFQFYSDHLIAMAPANPTTIMELGDYPWFHALMNEEWFTRGWGYDDQREGGWLIEAGDTTDFYVVVGGYFQGSCDGLDVDFQYYQDYNSPDITDHSSGSVRDGCKDSDAFNFVNYETGAPIGHVCPYNDAQGTQDSRNDDYAHGFISPDEYDATPSYGFGDRVAEGVQFMNGVAYIKFRGLVAEDVDVIGTNAEVAHMCTEDRYSLPVTPMPEEIEIKSQPATQVVMINHDGFSPKEVVCGEERPDVEEAFYINLQVADGFQNPRCEDVEVELSACLKLPFGDAMFSSMIDMYCSNPWNAGEEVCEDDYMDSEYCYTREDFQEMLMDTEFFGEYMGDVMFGDYFGESIQEWIDSYFDNADVTFYQLVGSSLVELPEDKVMTTDGQAEIYVVADKPGLYRVKATPFALDADFTFVSFEAGSAAQLDLTALPRFGVPADGEEEAMLLLRSLDVCGNLVMEPVSGVTVHASSATAMISQDFDCNNNYDNEVTGTLYPDNPLGFTCLAVLDSVPERVYLTAETTTMPCDPQDDLCNAYVDFQGAPVKLAITDITPASNLPADGMTGAWVTVQVQDANGNRVTGYLGDGYEGDPGDAWGMTDYVFENVCIDLDREDATVGMTYMNLWSQENGPTFGWMNLHDVSRTVWCGDLHFGEGKIYVVYYDEDFDHGNTVTVKAYDEVPYQGQEVNENGLPQSENPVQLFHDEKTVQFINPAVEWDIWTSAEQVAADGTSYTEITVQLVNKDGIDVAQAVEGVIVVSRNSGAWLEYDGEVDETNPLSRRFTTDPETGRAVLNLYSDEAGEARITVTGGDAYVCRNQRGPDCRYVDGVDLESDNTEVVFVEVADNQIALAAGWSFISTPYNLDTTAYGDGVGIVELNELLEDVWGNVMQVGVWDAAAQDWVLVSPEDEAVTPLDGYWVKLSAPGVITLEYNTVPMPSIPTKQVYAGWNTVGLTQESPLVMELALISMDDSYSMVIDWVEGSQRYGTVVANSGELGGGEGMYKTGGVDMVPKEGYWTWVDSMDVLAGLGVH